MTDENGKKAFGSGSIPGPFDLDTAPIGEVPSSKGMSGDDLRAFLKRPSTLTLVRTVIMARLKGKDPLGRLDDLIQNAYVSALEARSRPLSPSMAEGWLATITRRTVVDRFRRDAREAKYLDVETQVEELPPPPDSANDDGEPKWLLTAWLGPLVVQSLRDQETYELLLYKARTGKTYAQVADDHAMTEGALKNRVRLLRMKYEPTWKRQRRERMLIILCFVALAVAVIPSLLMADTDPVSEISEGVPAHVHPTPARWVWDLAPIAAPPPDAPEEEEPAPAVPDAGWVEGGGR